MNNKEDEGDQTMKNIKDNDDVNVNENEITDDPAVHWERCQESQPEKEKLQNEINTMNSMVVDAANISDDDIIEIDAGGRIIRAFRSTLTLAADTVFAYMFSGRWDESLKRDSNGRVFLDEDYELIEIIVNFLRLKKREVPSKPVQSPMVRKEKEESFISLLDYWGLTNFFFPSSVQVVPFDINNINVIQPHGFNVDVTKEENKIQFSKEREGGNSGFVACKLPLESSREGSFWKVTIDALPNYGVVLGIIGNLNASRASYEDSTSYGWASNGRVLVGGENDIESSRWNGFTEGDCQCFHLKSNKLTMFSLSKNRKFTVDIATTVESYYIHFIMNIIGTKLTLDAKPAPQRVKKGVPF